MMELKKDLVQLLRKGIIENEEDAKLFGSQADDRGDIDLYLHIGDYNVCEGPRAEVYYYSKSQIDEDKIENFAQLDNDCYMKIGDKIRFYDKEGNGGMEWDTYDSVMKEYRNEEKSFNNEVSKEQQQKLPRHKR